MNGRTKTERRHPRIRGYLHPPPPSEPRPPTPPERRNATTARASCPAEQLPPAGKEQGPNTAAQPKDKGKTKGKGKTEAQTSAGQATGSRGAGAKACPPQPPMSESESDWQQGTSGYTPTPPNAYCIQRQLRASGDPPPPVQAKVSYRGIPPYVT